MQPIDLLICASHVLTMEPATAVLNDHAVAVNDGRIVAVGPTTELTARYAPQRRVDRPGHALMPGLINLHTHSAMSLLRGYADDLALMEWLTGHIWPAEGRHVNEAFITDGVQLAMLEMIRSGQTCFNDMYFYAATAARAAASAGMRATIGLPVFDFPAPGVPDADHIAYGRRQVEEMAGLPLIRACWAPHAPYTVGDERLIAVRDAAREMGLGIHMHVHETAFEVADAIEKTGKRPWQRLRELGLLGPGFIAVHMTQLTDEEIAEVAALGVSVAHCPESNLKLASGFCPVQKLVKAGVNVGIGTDGAASNNDLDLLAETRIASLLAKTVAGDACAVPAPQALEMATLGGARALGLADEIGSLRAGKSADLISIDLNEATTAPLHHAISQLAYAANSRQVRDVWIAGRTVLDDRQFTTLDAAAVLDKARDWAARMAATPNAQETGA